jgi:hypothetical protein
LAANISYWEVRMAPKTHSLWWTGLVAAVVLAASTATADIEDQLSVYTGDNAIGYLQPLADAFGADLNAGLFSSAHIPVAGFNISLETKLVAVMFADEDGVFMATTESGFTPPTEAEVSTVVGPGEAVEVTGDGGSSYAFPGGFDLTSFVLPVPQLRVGSVMGTEALIRYIAISTENDELGDVSLYGFGLRHSISQYLGPGLPVDVAAGFFWQSFKLGENAAGEDLVSATAFTFGVQASRNLGIIEPYAGLSYDTFSMDVSYESESSGEPEMIDLAFDSESTLHLTLGLNLRLGIVTANGEYNIAGQNSFALGLGFGF